MYNYYLQPVCDKSLLKPARGGIKCSNFWKLLLNVRWLIENKCCSRCIDNLH